MTVAVSGETLTLIFSRKCRSVCVCPTCFMAVTVITKKRGRPLVTGLVGVSMISCRGEGQREGDAGRGGGGGGGVKGGATEKRGERMPSNATLSKEVQQGESFCNKESSTHPRNPILFVLSTWGIPHGVAGLGFL